MIYTGDGGRAVPVQHIGVARKQRTLADMPWAGDSHTPGGIGFHKVSQRTVSILGTIVYFQEIFAPGLLRQFPAVLGR